MLKQKRKSQNERRSFKKLKADKERTEYCFPKESARNSIEECCTVTYDKGNLKSKKHVSTSEASITSEEIQGLLIGDHETQVSEGGEIDLHKHFVGCKKISCHKQFIPVNTFTLKHLPKGFQDNDLYEYIKVAAELTIRVDVKNTSPLRPEFWPNTKKPYPFFCSDTKHLKTGSGSVWYVNKFENGVIQDSGIGWTDYRKCWCRKCQDSKLPSNVWWEFDVDTATHVVFDDIEASNTSLKLFFDSNDSPVIIVDKVRVYDRNIEHDWCWLKCVTCDQSIGNNLKKMWNQFVNIWRIVWNKYTDSSSKHKLNFIVSHPHGCSKQISVGQWIEKHKVGNYRTKLIYTTCTCPGSSGARVQCVGYNNSWLSELVHSGSLKSGLKYSGAGRIF